MQHVKPTSKGDPLCPLGFHPQVRWPTRCKRCFRDYKEHGNRNKDQDSQLRKDELTVSTPALSSYSLSSRSRNEPSIADNAIGTRNWMSSSNLSTLSSSSRPSEDLNKISTSSSWTSSPNLAETKEIPSVTVSLTLPRRKKKSEEEQREEDDARRTQYTVRRRTSTPISSYNNYETSTPASSRSSSATRSSSLSYSSRAKEEPKQKSEVDHMLQVKSAPKTTLSRDTSNINTSRVQNRFSATAENSESEDEGSVACTESTDTTIVNEHGLQDEIDNLKKELESMKLRCERAEREKSDFLLRRLAPDTVTSRTSSSEILKLQQKVNELKTYNEDLRDEKKSLSQRVRELENDLEVIRASGVQREVQVLRDKLQKAETVCEELVEANEDMKREIRDMEEEMDEMQDKFREDRADEYTSLKKELEQQTKNCRILSFKLRKAERKTEQLEAEKLEAERKCREVAGGQSGLDKVERIKQLEHDLSIANEAASRLQKELEEANSKIKTTEKDKTTIKKKAPKLATLSKTPSGEKMSRESLTRGDSQEDPVQLLRDLQDSLEREADLREQLRFAEEEAENLRKKSSRVEDDNESLVLQLKKMATKAKTRRLSPSHRLTPEPVEKDEGISDEDDPSELRILLELNEQEAAVLRRKVEDLEVEGDHMKRKVKELQEKLNSKSTPASKRTAIQAAEPANSNAIYEQKMKVLEEEMSELRKKLIEKERECERLHAEISLGAKKPKTLQKSKSLDGDQQTVDLKRQLQVIETEVNVLRTKTQDLEAENEKLTTENKKLSLMSASKRSSSVERLNDSKGAVEKQLEESLKKIKELEAANKMSANGTTIPIGEIEKLKTQLKKTEAEKLKNEEILKRLKDDALEDIVQYYQKRTPKIPQETLTKLQLKKMVNEVEQEIGEILVILKKTGGLKKDKELDALKDELDQTKKKFDKLIKEAKDENTKKEKQLEQLNKSIKDLENDKLKVKKEADKNKTAWQKEKDKLLEAKSELEKSKKELSAEVEKLTSDIKKEKTSKDDNLKKNFDALRNELEEEKKQNENLKAQLEAAEKSSSETGKVSKQLDEKLKKIEEMEKKIKEFEDKLKKSERLLNTKKDKLSKMEKENEELGTKIIDLEKQKNTLSSEKKALQSKYEESESKIEKMQQDLDMKCAEIKQLEKGSPVKDETTKVTKVTSKATVELNNIKEELKTAKAQIKDLTEQISNRENEVKAAQEELKSKEKQMKKEIEDWEKKASELEMDLQEATEETAADRKMMERLKANQEKEMKAKDQEIAQLRTNSLTANNKKIQELQSKVDRLEIALESEKHEYDELTSKYEQLEEEHVVMKATLVKEKEKIQLQLSKTENELMELDAELKDLRETYTAKHDSLINEKQKFEEKSKECETLLLEKTRLQAFCDEKHSEIEQLRKEGQSLSQQIECMRKENEELRKQMDDFNKVSKVQRNMSEEVSLLEKELKDCRTRLVMEEKAKKIELAKLKHRYDKRVNVMNDELLSIQGQVARFKRERDSYKHMFEDAQKSIGGIAGLSNSMDGDELKNHLASLEQQINVLEDELSESRVEASRLRTELVSERSAWEVKLSELNSKLNELEEEKILNSGRTKITGIKTRMELAWQKEREEQHRLLQETSTLARDLRQTLFEVERERDRERLEGKRRLDQIKKTNEEEQEELRKKVTEMQCDLLELRDAHAKLRTTNEKLRREKDKLDREREILRQSIAMKKKIEQDEERQIISVAQLVEELTVLAPDLFPSKPKLPAAMPTPPVRRKGPKSREASPALERKDYSRESSVGREDTKSQEVQEILRRLTEAANELRKSQFEDRDSRMRRSYSSFRASSIESDGGIEGITTVKHRNLQRKGSTLRKSLSLEQTAAQEQQAIWRGDDDKEGSISSIQSLEDIEKFRHGLLRRDQSLDSRLSGGSTQSEVLPSSEKKKKLGIFGKLKKLTKSKSIDPEGSDLGSTGQLDPGSDVSLAEDKASKQMKDKFGGMFKKSGSSSRGNSLERSTKPPKSSERQLTSSSSGTGGDSSSARPLTRKPPSTAPVQRKVKK